MVRSISLNMNFFCFNMELVKVHGGYMLTRHVGWELLTQAHLLRFLGFSYLKCKVSGPLQISFSFRWT